mgnify:CR=1 FL=1
MKQTIFATILIIIGFSNALAGPGVLNYQGSVKTPGGASIPDDTYDMQFTLFNRPDTGDELWKDEVKEVKVRDGLFSVILGEGKPFDDAFQKDDVWLEIAIDINKNKTFDEEEVFAPRQRVASAAWAIDSDRLGGRNAADYNPRMFDAVVDASGGGDFTKISTALNVGRKTIFVRNGTYVLSSPIEITQEGTRIVGESRNGVIIDCNNTDNNIRALGDDAVLIEGDIAITRGSTTVAGTDTLWSSKVAAGEYIQLNRVWYRIASVSSDTQLVLEEEYQGPDITDEACLIQSMIRQVQIENLSIRNGAAGEAAIQLEYVLESTVRNCLIQNNAGDGIYTFRSALNRIEGNVCRENYTGIISKYCYEDCISGNSCCQNHYGIDYDNSYNGTVTNNTCSNNEITGINVSGRQLSICGNVSQGNGYSGLRLYRVWDSAITGNSCANNGSQGIVLSTTGSLAVTGNSCENNQDGLYLFVSSECTVSNNTCRENAEDGFYIERGCDKNVIANNTFTSNGAYGVNIDNADSDNNIVGMNILTDNTSGAANITAGAVTHQLATNYPVP